MRMLPTRLPRWPAREVSFGRSGPGTAERGGFDLDPALRRQQHGFLLGLDARERRPATTRVRPRVRAVRSRRLAIVAAHLS